MDDPVDAVAPWTIKSIRTATRHAINDAARKEGLTVGQWLDRRVADWLADGAPVAVPAPALTATLGDLAAAMNAARELAGVAGVPVPKRLARDALRLVGAAIRPAAAPRARLIGTPTPQPDAETA